MNKELPDLSITQKAGYEEVLFGCRARLLSCFCRYFADVIPTIIIQINLFSETRGKDKWTRYI